MDHVHSLVGLVVLAVMSIVCVCAIRLFLYITISVVRARLGLKAPAWARLWSAQAYEI